MNKMTHDEMLKYSSELVVKNNPDEAVKLLVLLQKENELLNDRITKASEYIKKFEDIKAYYSYEENGYEEYNYDEDFKKELLEILRGVSDE